MTDQAPVTLHNLARYTLWAEEMLIEVLTQLDEQTFNTHQILVKEPRARDLRELVVHMVEGYLGFFLKFSSEEFKQQMKGLTSADKNEILDTWHQQATKFCNHVLKDQQNSFDVPLKGGQIALSPLDYYLMYTDHQTYHRGQVVLRLKELGIEGLATDYYEYIRHQHES